MPGSIVLGLKSLRPVIVLAVVKSSAFILPVYNPSPKFYQDSSSKFNAVRRQLIQLSGSECDIPPFQYLSSVFQAIVEIIYVPVIHTCLLRKSAT